MNEYYWDKFYENNVKTQIQKKGEAYIEWSITKNYLVKQLNFLRTKYKLTATYFQKDERSDVFCVFIKPIHHAVDGLRALPNSDKNVDEM